jgi:hypothetical protein
MEERTLRPFENRLQRTAFELMREKGQVNGENYVRKASFIIRSLLLNIIRVIK